MQRLIVRLIDSRDPAALQAALRWLYGFVRPQRLAIAGLLALSVCASLLVLVQPWLIKLLIDDGLLARNFPMLVMIAVLMIIAGLLGTALSGINRFLHTRLSGRILFALRDDLYRHL
jgi:ATP-binding cassette subfamily B protein